MMEDDDVSAVTLEVGKNPIGDDGRYRVDRSNVPLCGQTANHDQLVEIYENVANASASSSVVVIRGAAGTGKSTLVESLRSSVMMADPTSSWFVTGKFCQHSSESDPFSALVGAITDLIDLIVQNSTVDLYCKGVKAAIEHHELAFARLIPNIGLLTGDNYEVSSSVGKMQPQILAVAQFKAAFASFLYALGIPEHPLVIFLDDLQWVDDESLDFVKKFVGGLSQSKHMMVIGAARTDDTRGLAVVGALEGCVNKKSFETDKAQPWIKTSSKSDMTKQKTANNITFMDVGNVDEATVSQIISAALNIPLDDRCTSLGGIVHQKTMGNPFSVLQLLDLLISEHKIKMKSLSGSWEWNESTIRVETDISDNVVMLVERNLERLPKEVKQVLANASFLGFTFHSVELVELERGDRVGTAETRHGAEDFIEKCLTRALEEGLIECIGGKHRNEEGAPKNASKYKFSHDKILQACFDSVSDSDARELHLKIGTYLQRSGIRGDAGALDVASHFNRARLLLLSSSKDRVMLTRANFAAAKVANSRSAFGSSVSFLQIALRTIDYDVKWTDEYDLTLEMSRLLLEMCVACGKVEEVDLVLDEVLTNAKCIGDKLDVIQSKLVLLWSTCQYKEAISYGIEVLQLVGERVSEKTSKLQIAMLFLQARRRLNRLSDEEICQRNSLDSENVAFVLEVYASLATSAFFSGQTELSMNLMLRAAILSLDNGIHRMTPIALCHLGIAEFAFGNCEVAIRNGRLALKLTDEDSSSVAQTYVGAYTNLVHWTVPLEELHSHFKRGMRTGMAEGDIVWGYMCLAHSVYIDSLTGKPLEQVERSLRDLCSRMTEFQMLGGLFMAQAVWQFCLNLLGASEQCTVLAGEAMNEAEHANNPMVQQGKLQWYTLASCKFQLSRLVEETEQAEQLALQLEKNEKFAISFNVYDNKLNMALLWFQLASENTRRRKNKYLAKARMVVRYMKKMRGLGCPNFDGALLLCEAEEASLSNDPIDEVSRLYDAAIARTAGRLHHEAMAMEQAAKFHIRRRNMEDGRRYYELAKSKYMEWNAYAKVEDMESKAIELFSVQESPREAVNMTVVVPAQKGMK